MLVYFVIMKQSRILLICKFLAVMITIFNIDIVLVDSANAADLTVKDIENNFLQIQYVFNKRDRAGLSGYFNYYADPEAKFHIKLALVDTNMPDTIIKEEEKNMDRSAFIDYQYGITKDFTYYVYESKIAAITPSDDGKYSTVTLDTKETGVNETKDDAGNRSQKYVVVNGACNYNIKLQGSDILILGMYCLQKVAKYGISSDGKVIYN